MRLRSAAPNAIKTRNAQTQMNIKTNTKTRVKRHSFTLIELLIVIGLLGALTALILPSLSANREDALGDVCDYNQAGTVRVLKQYRQLFGHYPADMHTALQSDATTAVAMEGLPDAQEDHMIAATVTDPCPSLHTLTALEATSLTTAGITSVCHGTGLNSTAVAESVNVVVANNGSPWLDDGETPAEMTFDGVSLTNWAAGTNTPSWDTGAGVVVVLWIAPTTDWSRQDETAGGRSANNDWTNGAVEMGIDIDGQCPIPNAAASGDEVSFAYYMAYFKVYSDGSPARLIGTTCPECGVMNP
jgi:type II secretory pathway pseudopilin PulG